MGKPRTAFTPKRGSAGKKPTFTVAAVASLTDSEKNRLCVMLLHNKDIWETTDWEAVRQTTSAGSVNSSKTQFSKIKKKLADAAARGEDAKVVPKSGGGGGGSGRGKKRGRETDGGGGDDAAAGVGAGAGNSTDADAEGESVSPEARMAVEKRVKL